MRNDRVPSTTAIDIDVLLMQVQGSSKLMAY